MSIKCYLYQCTADKTVVDKTAYLTQQFELDILLKDNTSVTDPTFYFSYTNVLSMQKYQITNYAYVPGMARYYYVKNFRIVKSGVVELDCHVDVLMTYRTAIRQQRAIVYRQQNRSNLYLNDGVFKVYQNPIVLTREFPSGFTTQSFVLAVAGS